MKEVVIEYPVLFFFRKRKTIQVPGEWLDLTGRQFAVCCKTYMEPVTDIQFISEFFGIKESLAKCLDKFYQYKLIELAGFIANPKAIVNFFYMKEIPGTGLFAPEEYLNNVTFERFMLFDTLFFDYMNGKSDQKLANFIATLYIKKEETLSDIKINERVNYIAENVDKSTQYAIFLNYTFIRKWLSKAYTWLFGFTEEDPESEKSKRKKAQQKKPNRPEWNAILDSLVGDDILHYEDYKQMPCTLAFKAINNRIKNYHKYGK